MSSLAWIGALATVGLGAATLTAGLPASASAPTAAFAADGTLWVAWVDGRHVHVASSSDAGQTFSPPARVNPEPEAIDANGEARPKIALGPREEVFVSYTRKGGRPFTGDVRFSRRSPDGSFTEPITVNDDGLEVGHRFDTLAVAPSGAVHLFWIDKRDLELATRETRPYEGAALYHAVSRDGGRSFQANRKLKDHVCECCRLAIGLDGEVPVLLWRDLLEGGVRDHTLARFDGAPQPTPTRATDDGWEIAGCPHHGPALAIGGGGTVHLAWFTGDGKRGPGAFYRRSTDGGRSFSEPVRLGDSRAGRPQVLAAGKRVFVAWKQPLGDGVAAVQAVRSSDEGATWEAPAELARTRGDSDHPLLLARGTQVFLSWLSKDEGYRLIPAGD